MSLDDNKALARRAIEELWSKANVDVLDEIYSPDYVDHRHHHPEDDEAFKGTKNLMKAVKEFHDAFPNFYDTIEDVIAEGDKVVVRFTSQGVHKGKLMGIEPTNKEMKWTGIIIYRIENGKIAESWVNWDMMGMFQQMGVVSMPSQ